MKILRDGTALRQLSVLFNEGVTGAVADGQLLERFATRRGEASEHAFAALVERHGPVVLRLCRSILRDEHEAQDAFQATFLVLAQRAGSLWVRDSIGPWIHSVAYRVASCARAARIRRQRHERRHAELAAGRLAVYHDEDPENLAVVHEEIDRSPEHYRVPLSWQLYVMRPDGTDQRRITDGGNPFYARFSPDGRRVVYSDNGRGEQSGIWVIDVNGKNGRLVLPVETKPKADAVRIGSACWSPDGQRIAVLLSTLEESETKVAGAVQVVVVVVMDLDGGHRSEILHIPDGGGNDMPDMPDWR